MRAIRDVWAELVERRLWPVALLLLAALVAAPVLLAKHVPAQQQVASAGPDAPPVGAPAPPPGEPVVSVASGPSGSAPLLGRAKDPFHQQFVPARAASGGGTAPAGSGTATTPTGGGGGSTGGAGSPGGSAKPAPRTYVYASVDVSFGRAGSPLKQIKDVPRLAPLPSASDPIVIFMGTRSDHETAVFMLSTDVKAQGDGRCVPSATTCEAIELRRGGVALLDVTDANGFVTQYELDLDGVALHTTTSQAAASAANARVSTVGRRLLHTNAAQVALARALHWSVAGGALTGTRLAWLSREGSVPGVGTPEASAGAAASPPVLTSLP
jgi:hypothetical protein